MKIGPLSDPRVVVLHKLETSINEIIESKQRVLEVFPATQGQSDLEKELLTSIALTIHQLRVLADEVRGAMYQSFDMTVDASLKHRKSSVASGGGKKRAEKYKTPEMLDAERQFIQSFRDAGYPRGKDKFVKNEIAKLRIRCNLPELKLSTARGWLKRVTLKSA